MIHWWQDNLKRPSTWLGIACIVTPLVLLYYDHIIIHTLLMNMVNSPQFVELIISGICFGIGHFLVGYKKNNNKTSKNKQ